MIEAFIESEDIIDQLIFNYITPMQAYAIAEEISNNPNGSYYIIYCTFGEMYFIYQDDKTFNNKGKTINAPVSCEIESRTLIRSKSLIYLFGCASAISHDLWKNNIIHTGGSDNG